MASSDWPTPSQAELWKAYDAARKLGAWLEIVGWQGDARATRDLRERLARAAVAGSPGLDDEEEALLTKSA